MTTDLKVSFYLKREKSGKNSADGKAIYPIVGKIIIGKSIAQFGSKLKVEERLWNVKSGRVIGKSQVATCLNRRINRINTLIHRHYDEILKWTGAVSAPEVKNAFQGIASVQKTLLAMFEGIMQEFHLRVGIDRAKASYLQYVNTQKHLQRFLLEKYNLHDIPLSQLDLQFVENFDFYLRVERKLKPASVNCVIIQLISAAKTALHRNLISHPPFFGYKLERPSFQIRSLTANELNKLVTVSITDSKANFVRDLFVFSCFTGISYIDLKNLTWKEIVSEEDGSRWISKTRQKTGITFNVKLLDIPMQIIEKYRDLASENFVFAVPNLITINLTLKKIARLCGIDKTLSFHMSRHTFATQVCLSQGVPIESVSRMLGHTDIATTQRYAHVNNEKLGNDMKLLSAKLADRFCL
jgi:integrase